MLGLSKAMNHFAVVNSVHWYDHVLREDGLVLEGQ